MNGKRTNLVIRRAILFCLSSGQHTINQIAIKTSINWKTVELHLTYLIGKGLVSEIFSSQYLRIFELSDKGKEFTKMHGHFVEEENENKIIDGRKINLK